jgi:hypothetical protein
MVRTQGNPKTHQNLHSEGKQAPSAAGHGLDKKRLVSRLRQSKGLLKGQQTLHKYHISKQQGAERKSAHKIPVGSRNSQLCSAAVAVRPIDGSRGRLGIDKDQAEVESRKLDFSVSLLSTTP